MFITEQNGAQMWTKILKENFNVTDSEKLQWVSEYAAAHEIFESNIGLGGASTMGNGVLNAQNGLNPIYATPLNTLGMGNPMAPGQLPTDTMNAGDFFKQQVGSGDIPVSTLPMALNIALMTVGLELLPVVNAKGPWTLLSYMDFPYAGGKLGRKNEIANLDGIGDGAENKPLYVKVLGISDEQREAIRTAGEGAELTISGTDGDLKGTFKCFGRMDGGVIMQVIEATKTTTSEGQDTVANVSIMSIFSGENAINVKINTGDPIALTDGKFMTVDFAQTMVDFIDGFANFATGAKEPMTRAQNETGTGNVIGLRLFSKWVQMGSYEVTGTVTRQQLQDLPLYGVDAVAKIMESLQNEITQHINRRILDHVFALGVTNALNQRAYQGIDLNLYMGTAANKNMAATGILN